MAERIRWSWMILIEWLLDLPFVVRNAWADRRGRFRRDGWVIGQRLLDIPYTLRFRFSRRRSPEADTEAARRLAELHAELDARAAAVASGEGALAVAREEVDLRTRELESLARSLAERSAQLDAGEEKLDRGRAQAEERAELRRVALEQRDELARQVRSAPVEEPEADWWEKQLGGANAPASQKRTASSAK